MSGCLLGSRARKLEEMVPNNVLSLPMTLQHRKDLLDAGPFADRFLRAVM